MGWPKKIRTNIAGRTWVLLWQEGAGTPTYRGNWPKLGVTIGTWRNLGNNWLASFDFRRTKPKVTTALRTIAKAKSRDVALSRLDKETTRAVKTAFATITK